MITRKAVLVWILVYYFTFSCSIYKDDKEETDGMKHGCGRECYNINSTNEPAKKGKTGDYLLIPGGRYNNKMGGMKMTYYNDIYCGDGLGDFDGNGKVQVERPGPVSLR